MVAIAILLSVLAGVKDPGGFQDAKWGMTTQQVQRVFPSAEPEDDGGLEVEMAVAGREARVLFEFAKGRLARVHVIFSGAETPWEHVAQHEELRSRMAERYGSATDATEWDDDAVKGEPLGAALTRHDVKIVSAWDMKATSIRLLTGWFGSAKYMTALTYTSRKFGPILQAERERREAEEL